MSSQQRLNGSTNTVANELLLLRKLANLRRSASWQSTVERLRKAAPPDAGWRMSVGYLHLPQAAPHNPVRRRKVRPADHRSGLPGMGGAELIETVRTERPHLPAVMASV